MRSLARECCNLDQIKSNFPLWEERHRLGKGHEKKQIQSESLKPDQ